MMLKSFGCSFIFGTDLADDGRGEPYATPSQYTWPSLIAQHLDYNYQCHARPGSGNLRILEKIISIATQEPAVFVIGWSWIDRFDYTTDPTGKDHIYDLAGNNLWRTVMPIGTDQRTINYYRDLHSQYRDKLTNLVYIKTAIDILKEKQIPFLMTYMDELLFETQWHTSPAILELQEYIRPYMFKFDNLTFLDWSKKKGFPISETLHPLEQAHEEAFKLLCKQNTIDRLRHA